MENYFLLLKKEALSPPAEGTNYAEIDRRQKGLFKKETILIMATISSGNQP